MIPATREISSAVKLVDSVRRIGTPPATAASKNKSTPFISAIATSYCPRLAIKSLFAVTTCFLAFNERLIRS